MEVNARKVGKTALKVTGAACVATGIVLAGAVIASGAAIGSIAEGFIAAKKAAVNILKKDDICEAKETRENTEQVEVMVTEVEEKEAERIISEEKKEEAMDSFQESTVTV